MQFSDLLDKDRKCARDVLNPLSLQRRSRKACKVDGVSGLECLADLARLLEAADAWSLSGARIYDKDGALAVVDLHTLRRNDAQQRVVDRVGQLVAAHHQLAVIDQDRGYAVRQHLLALVAALPQDVYKQNGPLPEVAHILIESGRRHFAELAGQFVELIQSGRRDFADLAGQSVKHPRLPGGLERDRAQ